MANTDRPSTNSSKQFDFQQLASHNNNLHGKPYINSVNR